MTSLQTSPTSKSGCIYHKAIVSSLFIVIMGWSGEGLSYIIRNTLDYTYYLQEPVLLGRYH